MALQHKTQASHELPTGHVDLRSGIGKFLVSGEKKQAMTKIAKDELNALLNIVGIKLGHIASKLVISDQSKTIKSKHIDGAAKVLLGAFYDKITKKESKTTTLSSARVEKLMRGHASKLRMSEDSRHTATHILDFICKTIINKASINTENEKKDRITTRHMFDAIIVDANLKRLFIMKLKVTMAGSGVKKEKFERTGKKKMNAINSKITKQQNQSECYNIRKLPFERLTREAIHEHASGDDVRLSKDARAALQYFVEAETVKMLHEANKYANHADRIVLQKKDIDVVLHKNKRDGKSPVY